MNSHLSLALVEYRSEAYIEIVQRLCLERRKKIRLRPLNACSAEVATQALIQGLNVSFVTAPGDQQAPLPENVSLTDDVLRDDATLLFYPEAKSLAACLLDYLDLETGTIVAPVTGYSFRNKPLFVISIPKSGTHLLLELVRAFGYGDGVVCPEEPKPGLWYCLESSNTHTSAHSFFLDTVHRSHFGNRLHPFSKSPVIFIYRNPLDIVVSEANYYHEDGKTVFSGYLNHLCFEERLIRLIDDPWLLGTIMDRVAKFAAWLDFQNVVPVSFEELVGDEGGGSRKVQRKLIWSLQLKLQVPGDPEKFGERIFNPGSPTFIDGRIGSHKTQFTPRARRKFMSLSQDVMFKFGYDSGECLDAVTISKRAEEFRMRPLEYSEANLDETPVAVEYNYRGCNIVHYRGSYYILPQCLGTIDLSKSTSLGWKWLFIASCQTLEGARRNIYRSDSLCHSLFWKKNAARVLARVCRFQVPMRLSYWNR
jgi:hypothetical protein